MSDIVYYIVEPRAEDKVHIAEAFANEETLAVPIVAGPFDTLQEAKDENESPENSIISYYE